MRVCQGCNLFHGHIALAGQDISDGQIGIKAVVQANLRGLGLDLQRPFVAVAVLVPQGGNAVHVLIVFFLHAGLDFGKVIGQNAVY